MSVWITMATVNKYVMIWGLALNAPVIQAMYLLKTRKIVMVHFFSFSIWFDVSFSTSHADIVKSNETLINFPLLTWSIQIACKILQLFVSISRDNLIELIT